MIKPEIPQATYELVIRSIADSCQIKEHDRFFTNGIFSSRINIFFGWGFAFIYD